MSTSRFNPTHTFSLASNSMLGWMTLSSLLNIHGITCTMGEAKKEQLCPFLLLKRNEQGSMIQLHQILQYNRFSLCFKPIPTDHPSSFWMRICPAPILSFLVPCTQGHWQNFNFVKTIKTVLLSPKCRIALKNSTTCRSYSWQRVNFYHICKILVKNTTSRYQASLN